MSEAGKPEVQKPTVKKQAKEPTSKTKVLAEASSEFVFAVVGHTGSGTSQVAEAFANLLSGQRPQIQSRIIKARELIQEWADSENQPYPDGTAPKNIETATTWQNLGDAMRASGDYAAVARSVIGKIRKVRGELTNTEVKDGLPVEPDGIARAYIIDALRHPAEVNLLRHLYQDAFILIGVVCDQDVRAMRLDRKLGSPRAQDLNEFMRRDEKDDKKYGQQVAKTFQLADFYVDNTPDRFLYTENGKRLRENPEWDINEKLARLVRIVTHSEIERPHLSETAMHHAYSAKMRSACLSRQVGAALVDRQGNLLATGTNEVPKAGGGVYGENFENDAQKPPPDQRCAYRPDKYCSSTREQNDIIDEILADADGALKAGEDAQRGLNEKQRTALRKKLKDGRVGDTIEFSRAVHAEMDALLSASRSGSSTLGTRLFVTTYPCHYCARHIISAGVDEVQYIEPYFKSLAPQLHSDAIQQRISDWKPPSAGGSTVLFRPFTGVAPRLYRRAFFKDRELKNEDTGDRDLQAPEWGTSWLLRKKSYVQLEAQLTKRDGG